MSDLALETRILILAPTGRDGTLAADVLARAGILSKSCSTIDELCAEIATGAGALLLAEEAGLTEASPLRHCLDQQPPWSDLPILFLTRPGAESPAVAGAMDALQNVTVLERPVRIAALISVARTALRARARQYQLRAQLAELQSAEAALRAGDERKNEFLAVLAHELRNPLAPIRNAIQIIRNLADNDDRLTKVGEMMERQVTHLVRLVDDLLEVSRISRGKIELRTEPVDLATIIRSAVESSRPLIDALDHHLAIDLPVVPLTVEADTTRLSQVFSNLLNNAAKYTDRGGRIRLAVRSEGNVAVISVRDSGTGLAPDVLPVVFDMFVQGDHDTARAQGGLGIGLTLARSLVELHGGSIEARSGGLGCGSEFVVRLPLASADAVPIATPRAHEPPALAHTRVLIVDDNRDAADSLGALLGARHAAVSIAYSGPETLQLLDRFRPNVMVVDIGMPGMDGYSVARHVRRHPDLGNIMLIALTGWGQDADRRRTEAAGFDHHLTKPADVTALESLLARARSQRI